MGFVSTIRRWFDMVFQSKAREEFNVKNMTNAELQSFIKKCGEIYAGTPEWAVGGVNTINLARSICQETARLATLAVGIKVEGSARADWLQEKIDEVYSKLRSWVEYGAAYGTVILKPSIDNVDVVLPSKYIVTEAKNGSVTGVVFVNQETDNTGSKYYTRLEYHRYIDGVYMVTNKCYEGNTANDVNKRVAIENTPWADLAEEIAIRDLEQPLYSVLKMPGANPIEPNSPLGMPIFADALEELKDLDVAYSRNAEEIFDSERIVLLDADKLLPGKPVKNENGTQTIQNNVGLQKNTRERMELPKFVRNVMGNGQSDFYQEINPTLNTSVRLEGINSLLSQIGYKCGFSNGYFVFNQKTGMVTATQVESDDRRTLQMIKDVRDQLQACLDGLFKAMDEFASIYELAPEGEYEIVYDFGDLTYSYAEDKATWWSYVTQGKVAFWRYLVKFEGLSEEEAKELEMEAQTAQMEKLSQGLFTE